MPKGEHFYSHWADKVVDGTRCRPESYDICVNGKCEVRLINGIEYACKSCNQTDGIQFDMITTMTIV